MGDGVVDGVVFHVEVACVGALLDSEDRERELRRILRVVSDRLEDGISTGALFDTNGNHVGNYWFEDTR